MGVYSSALIPAVRPSHCLQVRISNVSQPTSSDIIITASQCSSNERNMSHWYNTPSQTLQLHYSVLGLKVAKFDCTDSNVQKTSFPSACPTNDIVGLWIPLMLCRPALVLSTLAIADLGGWTSLVFCKITKSSLIFYN